MRTLPTLSPQLISASATRLILPPLNFTAVEITTLPAAGTLTDNGVPVTAWQLRQRQPHQQRHARLHAGQYANGAADDSFTFQVQDDSGTANGGIDTDPNPETMTIDVTFVNQPPVGTDNTISLNENAAYTFGQEDFGFPGPQQRPIGKFPGG